MAVHGYTKNYKLIKPQFDTDTWHDYEYDNLDTIDAVLSAIFASGDWKGFWKTNTHYSVGGVVIDRATDTMYKIMVEHTSSAATFSEEQAAHPDYYELWSPNDLAESWATKTDDKVAYTDYSAKAYAVSSGLTEDGSAKEWAISSGAIGNTGEYSAKKYATDAHNDYISMTTNANVAAVGSNINNVNAVGQSISSVNTVANNISDVNTAALNIEAIKDAPNQANAASQSASDASQSATNAANSATASANSATASATSANNSHIWAEGTDAQVQALGGVHSSKVWAEQSTNANIALTNSPYTTNRILEIPQDIKLELNNGTLTLKAGSKVYVPNGFEADGTTPKFYVVTLTEDKSRIGSINTTGTSMVFTSSTGEPSVFAYPGDGISQGYFSGPTAPTGHDYMLWYDTANNIVKTTGNGGSTWISYASFPIAIVSYSSDSSGFTSIDQIFNGFGYIGSTVFALPGVKVQIPDGRNEDGTCRSIITTVGSVKTTTRTDSVTTSIHWYLINNNSLFSSSVVNFDVDKNIYVSSTGIVTAVEIARGYLTSGKITSFELYTVDSVVNSNEFYQLKDKAVTTDTNQIITGSKRFTQPSAGMSIELTADTNQQTVPTTATSRQLGLYRNSTHTKGDGYTAWLEGYRGADGTTMGGIFVQRFLEGDNQTIMNYVQSQILADGTPVAYTRTPPVNSSGDEIVTAGWVNAKAGVLANTDASNFTAAGKETVVGWGMPDYSAGIDISGYKSSDNQFTAPKDGILSVTVNSNTNGVVYINDTVRAFANNNDSYARASITLPISKGEKFYAPSVLNTTTYTSCFYPFKGVN